MPYQQRYHRIMKDITAKIEIDGQSYTYVKRKIEGDMVIFQMYSQRIHGSN